MVTVGRKGHKIVRNSSFFKKIPAEAPAPQQASALPRSSPSAPTAIFPCPVPTGGGQRRAAVAPDIQQIDPDIQQNDPDIQRNGPAPPPPLAAFHPPLDADIAQEPFALPPDINPPRYNLRRGARELND